MLGLEELKARYGSISEKIQDRKYVMDGCLSNKTKVTYDIKEILDIWSNVTMEDLDKMYLRRIL